MWRQDCISTEKMLTWTPTQKRWHLRDAAKPHGPNGAVHLQLDTPASTEWIILTAGASHINS